MPKGDNKPWPWNDLEIEWLSSKKTDFPFVTDFLKIKGIPLDTGFKHTKGWQAKRDAIAQRAAEKAVTRLEKETGSMVENQGRMLATLLDLSFKAFLECDKKGEPVEPFKFKKGLPIDLVARLFTQSALLQQRLLGIRIASTAKIVDGAMYKTGMVAPGEGPFDLVDENSKVLALLKNPKAYKIAEQLRDAMGKQPIDVE